jgi:hypothetical protein
LDPPFLTACTFTIDDEVLYKVSNHLGKEESASYFTPITLGSTNKLEEKLLDPPVLTFMHIYKW